MVEKFSKSQLSEADIISKFILPAIKANGWNDMTQIRQEVASNHCAIVGKIAHYS
ncbi:hypothetical protein [Photobacterium angustum]|uniref:hypothetical protein n=1 Tax=Photobacterium angustum TaxID=661 RepID=UPI001C632F6E|nr:hypothetical protein [Photobacterium angustum]